MVALSCETDFVAKNVDFIAMAKTILDFAADNLFENIDQLKEAKINNQSVADMITERSGVTGEKWSWLITKKLKLLLFVHTNIWEIN